MSENDFSGVKQLRRTRDGRIVAGVAAGLGRYVGIDPNIIRAILAVATIFGGLGVALYAVGWLLLPEEGKDRSIVQDLIENNKDNPAWLDARAKAERGWREGLAKAEQGWARATHNDRTGAPYQGHQGVSHPTHQDPPASYPDYRDPVSPYAGSEPPRYATPQAPRGDDEPKPQV
ncbi:PspC domain-containing protein [Planobispora takensis]|uniref:Phage shock protein PspC N-terminal domain-containing protein n=1 Tax=Planobispora takensis TaxID=1367882 RepID=A0A8J3T1X2_9ACTN|nr:PspC domain-containing protein [Planobispora takensis]GII04243.1 hypothetical protein Pta02_62510 [Planobispora takensis]